MFSVGGMSDTNANTDSTILFIYISCSVDEECNKHVRKYYSFSWIM